jgi:hypothetical protein
LLSLFLQKEKIGKPKKSPTDDKSPGYEKSPGDAAVAVSATNETVVYASIVASNDEADFDTTINAYELPKQPIIYATLETAS